MSTQLNRTLEHRRRALETLKDARDRQARPLPGGRWKLPGGEVQPDGKSDDTNLALTYVISSISQDRDGDVLVPRGLEPWLWSYERAPVVLLDHDMSQPVGLSRDPGGNLTVRITDQDVRATCHFHQNTELAVQTYALAKAGVLGMASVGFIPHVGQFPPAVGMQQGNPDLLQFDRQGIRFLEWEMGEWSVLAVGSNRDAVQVRDALTKRWDGKPLCAPLRRLLSFRALPRKPWSKGASLPPHSGKTRVETQVQSVLLDRKTFPGLAAARTQVEGLGFDASEVRETPGQWVFVQRDAPACTTAGDCRERLAEGVTAVRCAGCSCGCGDKSMKTKEADASNGKDQDNDKPGMKALKAMHAIAQAAMDTVEQEHVVKHCMKVMKLGARCAHKAYPDLAEKSGFGKPEGADDDDKDDDDEKPTMEKKDGDEPDKDDKKKKDEEGSEYEDARKRLAALTGKDF